MNAIRRLIAVARIVAVLAVVAGVLAMHSLAGGHHGDVPVSAQVVSAQSDAAQVVSPQSHTVQSSHLGAGNPELQAVHSGLSSVSPADDTYLLRPGTPCGGGCAPSRPLGQSVHLLDVCLAILLAAATALLRALTSRRACARLVAAVWSVRLTIPRVPRPIGPGPFTLGVLRT